MALLRQLLLMRRSVKRALMFTLDIAFCYIASVIAFSLRLGEWSIASRAIFIVFGWAALSWMAVAIFLRIYHSIVRYAGSREIVGLALAITCMSIPMIALFMFFPVDDVPRTIAIIQPIIFLLLLTVSRIVIRYLLVDLLGAWNFMGQTRSVVIYGAGIAGQQLAAAIRREAGMALVGFVDDDARLAKHRLDGFPVYHSSQIGALVERLAVSDILLALPSISRAKRKRIVDSLSAYPVRVRMLPGVQQLVQGDVSINDLREVRVEDLLGRDAVEPDAALLRSTISDKVVFVSGAGGSIGSELCRQIVNLRPRRLILFEMSEHALYNIDRELREREAANNGGCKIVAVLGNACDATLVERIIQLERPDTIFHAAAYKHVPLVEENPEVGIVNNVCGTLTLARAAINARVARFILISTDKAVRPTNVMGASKRLCELICQALADTNPDTVFSMVRFGNVLGSSGSVVPLFQRQIAAGGPITLTHLEVTRYFMTIPEAAQLVIQAGAMARGGEVFVLDMGQPVRIYDLARTMIQLSGLSVRDDAHPDGDIEIVAVGMRPGEKLYEELLIGQDAQPTPHPSIMCAHESKLSWPILEQIVRDLRAAIEASDKAGALRALRKAVPEFQVVDKGGPVDAGRLHDTDRDVVRAG